MLAVVYASQTRRDLFNNSLTSELIEKTEDFESGLWYSPAVINVLFMSLWRSHELLGWREMASFKFSPRLKKKVHFGERGLKGKK